MENCKYISRYVMPIDDVVVVHRRRVLRFCVEIDDEVEMQLFRVGVWTMVWGVFEQKFRPAVAQQQHCTAPFPKFPTHYLPKVPT